MAYYAKISNQEFTVSERARLSEARHEKNVIENDNRMSDEYATLKTAYYDSFTSATLQALQDELAALQSQDWFDDMTEEEMTAYTNSITAKQAEIAAEKAALIPGQETALASLKAKEVEGTEDLVTEIESLNTTIANALCRVTAMNTGADEIKMVRGDTSELDNQVKILYDSIREIDSSLSHEDWMAAEQEIKTEIQDLYDNAEPVADVEFDDTEYWENQYGGTKRTSYNTSGGVHQLGGTPFRKNYAGVGYIYDPVRDAFYPPQPYASWTLDEDTCYWQPPTPRPEGMDWYWSESVLAWTEHPDKPYPSWTWDTTNGEWNPPVDYPENYYPETWNWIWNEETLTWVEK